MIHTILTEQNFSDAIKRFTGFKLGFNIYFQPNMRYNQKNCINLLKNIGVDISIKKNFKYANYFVCHNIFEEKRKFYQDNRSKKVFTRLQFLTRHRHTIHFLYCNTSFSTRDKKHSEKINRIYTKAYNSLCHIVDLSSFDRWIINQNPLQMTFDSEFLESILVKIYSKDKNISSAALDTYACIPYKMKNVRKFLGYHIRRSRNRSASDLFKQRNSFFKLPMNHNLVKKSSDTNLIQDFVNSKFYTNFLNPKSVVKKPKIKKTWSI